MRVKKVVGKVFKVLGISVLLVLALVVLIVALIYTPIGSEMVRRYVVENITTDSLRIEMERLNIDFPATVSVEGLRLEMIPPMSIRADYAEASLALKPLLDSRLRLNDARVEGCRFYMTLMPAIDSLGVTMEHAQIDTACIDLNISVIDINTVVASGAHINYIAPDEASLAAWVEEPEEESAAEPWTVRVNTLRITGGDALYTTRGLEPCPGLDVAYIQVDSIDVAVDNFYNRAEVVTVPLRISGHERCGVDLAVTGTLRVDSTATRLDSMSLVTPPGTALNFNALIGMGDLLTEPETPLAVNATGVVAPTDLSLMLPDMAEMFDALPADKFVETKVDVDGTAGALNINDLQMIVDGVADLAAHGSLNDTFTADIPAMQLAIDCRLTDVNSLRRTFGLTGFTIPPTTLSGDISLNTNEMEASLRAATGRGILDVDASMGMRADDYCVALSAHDFPINRFMPDMGIGAVSAEMDAEGRGFDITSQSTFLDAAIDISSVEYEDYTFKNLGLTALIEEGSAFVTATADDPMLKLGLAASGNLAGDTYEWQGVLADLYLDAYGTGLTDTDMIVSGSIAGGATIAPEGSRYDVRIDRFAYTDSVGTIYLNDVAANLATTDSTTIAGLTNRDMAASLSSAVPLQEFLTRLDSATIVMGRQFDSHIIDVAALQQALPPFNFNLKAGGSNILSDILSQYEMGFNTLDINASNARSLAADMTLLGFNTPTMVIDTITADMSQYGQRMAFTTKIDNRPGTFDEWAHVRMDGFFANNSLRMTLNQRNIDGREGYNTGLGATLGDSTLTLFFDPTDPTIAYRPWKINDDNYISWSFARRSIDANLHMSGGDSSVELITAEVDSIGKTDELIARINDINIADWVNFNPFAPPVTGKLNMNMRLSGLPDNIHGSGTVSLDGLTYDRRRVGDIAADLDVSTDRSGRIRASADVAVDGARSITLAGALNDSTAGSPLALDFSMIHFPLSTVNPFLPRGMASLRGTLNGSMDIGGTADAPTLDGWLQFDSAAVYVDMLATSYPISAVRIPVEGNIITLNDFAISGVNGQAMALNGTADIRSLADPQIDLALTTSNFQICDSKRAARGADIYGKGFIDVDATVSGNMRLMRLNADISVLPGTNISYVMTDAGTAIQSYSTEGLVRFVNFADTTTTAVGEAVPATAMLMQASLNIADGTTITIDLSSNGQDRVRILPEGRLNMSMLPMSDPRITGRLNINSGFARYTPPFMTEKLFNFSNGSYIAFTGDMFNPTLNIQAVDPIRANVTQAGQNSRVIEFDVSLSVTGTLNNMNVAFDLSTDDDATVANELQSMSPSQRANQAMNMLLYNVYTGTGTTADSNLSGNILYSFLSSQLNSWAARTIKGVDLSFGIDQYDRTLNGSTSTTTNYTYSVSKSLFNDRFKIVVGGNYTTDANIDENFAENLIKNISFEYFLNNARTMYLRLFRHTGYESILEGEITRTGVGFVYRRKLTSLRQLFSPRTHALPLVTLPADE